MIEGVYLKKLNRIPDERGEVLHILKGKELDGIHEVYITTLYPGIIKGWHNHRVMTCQYVCVRGMVKIVLHKDGEVQEYYLGERNYQMLTIPPDVWIGIKSIGPEEALVVNCSDTAYGIVENEMERVDPKEFSYDWEKINK